MTARPIIFTAPMVRAILDGRKTMTRRVLRPQPESIADKVDAMLKWRCGDTLWVREAWKPGSWRDDGRVAVDYRASPELMNTPWTQLPRDFDWELCWQKWCDELRSAGSIPDNDGIHRWAPGQSPFRWRSPIHMPRWASRIDLRVTGVKVERLQDISEDDAMAEGLESTEFHDAAEVKVSAGAPWSVSRLAFAALWNSIHGPDAWDQNPWVAAISFERVKP